MSQTKNYNLPIEKTIVKTYILKKYCNIGLARTGNCVSNSLLVNALPTPNNVPEIPNKATGNINVFPNPWKNSQKLTFFVEFIIINPPSEI